MAAVTENVRPGGADADDPQFESFVAEVEGREDIDESCRFRRCPDTALGRDRVRRNCLRDAESSRPGIRRFRRDCASVLWDRALAAVSSSDLLSDRSRRLGGRCRLGTDTASFRCGRGQVSRASGRVGRCVR